MAVQKLQSQPQTAEASRRQGSRRKLAVVLGGALFGGAAGVSLEGAGIPAQPASTLGGAATALIAAADELREKQAEPRAQRLERLRGDVYRHPLLVGFYVALAVFLAANLVAIPGVFTAQLAVVFALGEDFRASE